MDVFKIIEALGAEIACNRAVVRVGDTRVVVAKVMGDAMKLTTEGEEMAKSIEEAPQKAPAKRKRARNDDGTLKGDDPSTPDVNEAWTDGDS
jgi:hypothetical protein